MLGWVQTSGARADHHFNVGVAPLQVSKFHPEQRYQNLPVYTQDAIVLSRVFRGSSDATHCAGCPEPETVAVVDNASVHHSERVAQMCADAGVKSVYLPPYSPDLNLIEEFAVELNSFIKH
ncbi:hypothetical protein N7454_004645 [Penicillium verhagenii]|nr:hypothetical protein N7454_004645 [Penicillium verhagenii]